MNTHRLPVQPLSDAEQRSVQGGRKRAPSIPTFPVFPPVIGLPVEPIIVLDQVG